MSAICNELIAKWYDLSEDALRSIKQSISKEMELGLRDEESSTIKMLITYVRELSSGDETGSYLALDLGGTHFRVLLVTLNGDGEEPRVISVTHDIPSELLGTKNGQELFDYIALKLLEFVQQHKLKRRRISLGFTFSFPCKQYGLTQSYLVKWCKGFNVGGVVGTDVVKQLKDALKRQLAGLVEAYIDVVAVINDTTGTLVACANKHRECRVGLIVGTGFNACFMERLDRCEKWPANYTNPKQVIVNCEWGAMGDNKERRELDRFRNEFDAVIDSESVNPRNQTYEKMVSGMYVGELLRLTLLRLYQNKLIFQGSAMSRPGEESAKQQVQQGQQALASLKSKSPTGKGAKKSPVSKANEATSAPPANHNEHNSGSTSTANSPKPDQLNGLRSELVAQQTVSLASLDTSTQSSTLANGTDSHKLNVRNILDGRDLSMLAKDELSGKHEEVIKIMKELNITRYTRADLQIVIQVGSAIMTRSAYLVAAGISALLERLQHNNTVIGYDGSVIKHHPFFLKKLIEKTATLTPKEFGFEFVQSSDGSGIGAAVVAAALHKERRPMYIVKPGKLYEMHFPAKNQQSLLNFDVSVNNTTQNSNKQSTASVKSDRRNK